MRVLLLGYSDIARRRVLPALAAAGFGPVDVASRSKAGVAAAGQGGRVYDDYAEALADSKAPLVWVSTANASHGDLVRQALESGRHVVVDKPATTQAAETGALVALARARGLILAEATVWAFHPLVAAIGAVFAQAGAAPAHLIAAFSYPPLPPDNFRHRADLGGGMVMDLGPYAMSAGRVFFGAPPESVQVAGSADDSGFSVLASYPGGRTLCGRFGTGTGYVNRLTLLGAGVVVSAERVFSTPPDLALSLSASIDNRPVAAPVAAADSFALFLAAVRAAIASGDGAALAQAMIDDSLAVEQLR